MTSASEPLHITGPAELVAALPYLLGFHPRESLVLVATGGRRGRRLGLTVRIDLPPPDDVGAAADAAVQGLMLDHPEGAAVVVVGGGADPQARPLVDRVVHCLLARCVDVHPVLWAADTTTGARWSCYGDPPCCGGVLPDPAGTAFAAAAVVGGVVAMADRADLAHRVAAADGVRIARREAMILARHDRIAAGMATPADRATALAVVDAALDDAARGRLELGDERVVALAVALADTRVRDAAMLRGTGGLAAAAEHLWAALCRETPAPEAAEPAALLAVTALLRGDGALAHVALDRAEQAWPGHRLTALLRQAADSGIRPRALRECLGIADAALGRAG
jgi:hypothetical protein